MSIIRDYHMVILVIARSINPIPDYQGSRIDTKGDDQNPKLNSVCHILKNVSEFTNSMARGQDNLSPFKIHDFRLSARAV